MFAGQRNDGFFVDLGAIFDLGDIRELNSVHLIPSATGTSVDPLKTLNIHTIAIKVPISMLTKDGSVPSPADGRVAPCSASGAARAVARCRSRRQARKKRKSGPWVQVSRLGNPLFNEVIVPVGDKDDWNAVDPIEDKGFAKYVKQPELAKLLPVLYPGAFPNLAAYTKDRADLEAILLTGIPTGVVPGFQNFTTTKPSDMLRLNVAIPPTTDKRALGLIGGDARRLPERAAGVRRRRLDRAEGGGRCDDPARRSELRAGRRSRGSSRRTSSQGATGTRRVPVPRYSSRRIRHALVVSH